jgi:hypothetical protein
MPAKYPWGDEIRENLANCVGCGSEWDDIQSAPVGSFPPNDEFYAMGRGLD